MNAESPQHGVHRSAAGEQLGQGFPWLRFERSLESAYQVDQYEHGLRQLRLNIGLAIGLVLAFVALGRIVVIPTGPLGDWLVYGIIIPSLAACLGTTFIPHGSRVYRGVTMLLGPLVLAAVVVLVLNAAAKGYHDNFTGLVLAVMFVYYLLGLSFYSATCSNLIGMVLFIAGSSFVEMPMEQATYQGMVLFFANLVGAAVAYNLEAARRTGWLEARMLAELAERDGLTGVYNRRRLEGHLRRVWQQGTREQRPVALLMIDIDYFKAFNDLYGHQAGDEALKAVAGVLRSMARRPLDFVARYGGEEFLVVLYDTTREYAAGLANRTLEGVRELKLPHAASPAARVLTVSIGVAYLVPTAGRSVDGFVQFADEALYAAKHSGRNRVQVMQAEYQQMRTGAFRLFGG